MNLFGRNLESEVAVVAEIGVNHEGNAESALRLLTLAASAGADAVKFQSYTPERFIECTDTDRFNRVQNFALDEVVHRSLATEALGLGISFFSTAVSEDWVPIIAELGEAIKIASGDLTFENVIRAAAQTGKPVIISTGLGCVEEIDTAIGWLREEIGETALRKRVVLMHCVSSYPTPKEQANVRSVPYLYDRYGLVTGYSNHVVGPEACLAAVALGARVVEVHFTDNKIGRSFRDHELSFEPDELSNLITSVRGVRASLGKFNKQRQECELDGLYAYRKGVVAARELEPGALLQRSDLMFARPASEFAASEVGSLVGRRLMTHLARGELIRRNDLDN